MRVPERDAGGNAKSYWRDVTEALLRPEPARELDGTVPLTIHRREWLKLLGASLALGSASACNPSRHQPLLPYVHAPEQTPGVPLYYATTFVLDGFATGVLGLSHEGRPTKIEGNPQHPASLGAAGIYEQASVLSLYDPDRAAGVRMGSDPSTMDAVRALAQRERNDRGRGLRFLLEPHSSPTLARLLERVAARHPLARWVTYSPVACHAERDAMLTAFGEPLIPDLDCNAADLVISLDADFLAATPRNLRHARAFAAKRRTARPEQTPNRLYVFEPRMTVTGSFADHRFALSPSSIVDIVMLLVARVGRSVGGPPELRALVPKLGELREPANVPVDALVRDIVQHRGSCLFIAGQRQPAPVHLAVAILNALVNPGLRYRPSPLADGTEPFAELIAELESGAVDTLVIAEGNPVYNAPDKRRFAAALARAGQRIYLGGYDNETARACNVFLPAAHYLESWGDARSEDGTVSFVQPLVERLADTVTVSELLAMFAGAPATARELLEETWRERAGSGFAAVWDDTLTRGLMSGTASLAIPRDLRWPGVADGLARHLAVSASPPPWEIAIAADDAVYDGRFANNPWLQELPRPVSKLTWDNAVHVAPSDAQAMGWQDGALVTIEASPERVLAWVQVSPGHAARCATVTMGYGRRGSESIAEGVGFDAYPLYTQAGVLTRGVAGIFPRAGDVHTLAATQLHFAMRGRTAALHATLDEWRREPDFTREERGRSLTLYQETPRVGQQWAMSIDLSMCTGCSACVVACQAENNVLVVGKADVVKGREMHWLRIDTYYAGDPDRPEAVHQPMLCQHCEKAPCEYVCPVNATVHSPDGLNEMVYNRCVGTRFCSNNCPYKVRRFNWFDWKERTVANQGRVSLQRNPDVTVRDRGVMEKCTYCVQRIRQTEIRAREEDREIRPNEVVTACAQACPTEAIQFGSLGHHDTKMVQWRNESRAYQALHELGASPRTQYLARIRNPNPEIG